MTSPNRHRTIRSGARTKFRNSVQDLLGVKSGWELASPDQPIQLSHTLQVTGGVAGRDPAQKIVDGFYGTGQRSGQYHGCRAFTDFRGLLKNRKTWTQSLSAPTDHLHAVVSAAAMKKRKHVFCQKPLTHTVYEARRIAEIARETGVRDPIRSPTKRQKPLVCCANGSGPARSGRCAR